MKKITYICDNCGKEVDYARRIMVLNKIVLELDRDSSTFDICPSCFDSLIKPLYKNRKNETNAEVEE